MNTKSVSGPQSKTKSLIKQEDAINQELQNLKKQNIRLSGEVAILRQNLITVEKENYSLKEQRNIKIIDGLKKADDVKKELKMLQIENKIKENQLRAFKKPKIEADEFLDYKWILSKVNNEIKFSLYPFELQRLKILNSYFYEEFTKLLDDNNIEIELMNRKNNFKEFYGFFKLFCGKKAIFDKFFIVLIEEYLHLKNKKFSKYVYKILYYSELNWILGVINDNYSMNILNDFLEYSIEDKWSLMFYYRIAKHRPFLLNLFLTNERFQKIVTLNFDNINYLFDNIPENIFINYITVENIDLIDKQYLKKIYKDEYFDLL